MVQVCHAVAPAEKGKKDFILQQEPANPVGRELQELVRSELQNSDPTTK
jgi:hypothetical protein